MTIVKQYIPDDDPSITSEKLSDLYHEKLTIIKEDFASTFTEQELSTDLFQVYERVVPEITVSLEGRELILHGEEFQKSFYFVSGSTKIVVDGNNVEYEVKYDR